MKTGLKPSTTIRRVYGELPKPEAPARRVAILAHYAPKSIPAYVVHLLQALRRENIACVLCSCADEITDRDLGCLLELCSAVVHRTNAGRDFGAYADGLRVLPDVRGWHELLLLNDSFYGPLFPLQELLDQMEGVDCDFWGVTDSWDRKYHLQSYFVSFRQPVLQSQVFKSFFDSVRNLNEKEDVIHYGEVGLTQSLLGAGFRVAVQYPYNVVAQKWMSGLRRYFDESFVVPREFASSLGNALGVSNGLWRGQDFLSMPQFHNRLTFWLNIASYVLEGRPVNPGHFFWDVLIKDFRCPFLKIELLRDNPSQIANLYTWRDLVREVSDYDVRMIDEHLQQVCTNRVP